MSRPKSRKRGEYKKDGHRTSFWNKKWEQYKEWVIQQVEDGKVPVHIYDTKKKFRDAYVTARKEYNEGIGPKDLMKRLQWETMWNTKIKVAYGFKQQLDDLDIKDVSVKELRRMRHQEIIDKYSEQIKKVYKDLKDKGMKPEEAGKIISANWFRSP